MIDTCTVRCRPIVPFLLLMSAIITTDGKFMEKFDPNKCNCFYDDITTFGVPYQHCISHCDVVNECVALSYKPLMSACILHSNGSTPSECQGYVYTRKADWTKGTSSCYCSERQQCEENGLCGVEDMTCPALSDPSKGKVLGNKFIAGNRVKIVCNQGYVASGDEQKTCKDGQWSGVQTICQLNKG